MFGYLDFAMITFAFVMAVINAIAVFLMIWFICRSMNNDN